MDDSKAMDDSKVKESETKTESVTDKVETLIDFGTDSKTPVAPLYENIDIFYQNSVDEAGAFPLDLPTNVLEPPKEKPPPPPTDDSPDDELLGNVSFFISWRVLSRTYYMSDYDVLDDKPWKRSNAYKCYKRKILTDVLNWQYHT